MLAESCESGGRESQVSPQLRLPFHPTLIDQEGARGKLLERRGLRPWERIRDRAPWTEELQPLMPARAAPGREGGPGAQGPS